MLVGVLRFYLSLELTDLTENEMTAFWRRHHHQKGTKNVFRPPLKLVLAKWCCYTCCYYCCNSMFLLCFNSVVSNHCICTPFSLFFLFFCSFCIDHVNFLVLFDVLWLFFVLFSYPFLLLCVIWLFGCHVVCCTFCFELSSRCWFNDQKQQKHHKDHNITSTSTI